MNKPNVTSFIDSTKTFVTKHSPEILTGIGIAGMLTTTVLAVKATPKALRLIEDAQYEKGEILTAPEKVKVAWKPYIPAAVTGACSIACLIGSSSVSVRRNAALATAYNISQTALNEYKEQVIETVGEKKEKQIREKIAQKKVDDNPVSKTEVFVTGKGEALFLDPISMRYFNSDIERMRKVVNDINYRMINGMEEFVSLSYFYNEIGLKPTSRSDDLGWNLGRDGQLEIDWHATIADDGRPCLELEYGVEPRYDYHKLM